MSSRGAVPVLMYHSVGRFLPDWGWSRSLTVPASVFEDHLRWLVRSGYRSATLDELYAHVSGKSTLPPRSVVLTFDDGYVDNWTYVVPLLTRYNFTGTILVTPEFVDPRDIVRPTLDDVWAGRVPEEELEVRGFASWPELRIARDRGVLTPQCHALTHTWYATGPEVVDWHHPGDSHYWLDWNADPDEKPFYLRHPRESKVPWGTPVYLHAKALEATRYFPAASEADHCAAFVAEHGGREFFEQSAWRDALASELGRHRETAAPDDGCYETPEERRARFTKELQESKRQIEQRLGTTVDYLVWPGGGYNDESLHIARSMFKAATVGRAQRSQIYNRPGEDPGKISRRGIPSFEPVGETVYPGGRYLVDFIDEFRGVPMARQRRQTLKLWYLTAARLGIWP